MSFGENLKRLRLGKRLSQNELAVISGVEQYCISVYENGLGMPTSLSLCLIAEALGVTMDELYGEGR